MIIVSFTNRSGNINQFVIFLTALLLGTAITMAITSCSCLAPDDKCLTNVFSYRLMVDNQDAIFSESPIYHPDSIRIEFAASGLAASYSVLPDKGYVQLYVEKDSTYLINYSRQRVDTIESVYKENYPCCSNEGVARLFYNGQLQCTELECSFTVIDING